MQDYKHQKFYIEQNWGFFSQLKFLKYFSVDVTGSDESISRFSRHEIKNIKRENGRVKKIDGCGDTTSIRLVWG